MVWQNPSKVGQISTKLVIFVVRLALQHGKWFVDDFNYLVCKYHKTEIVHCGDSFIFWYYNQLLNDGNHMCTKFPWSNFYIWAIDEGCLLNKEWKLKTWISLLDRVFIECVEMQPCWNYNRKTLPLKPPYVIFSFKYFETHVIIIYVAKLKVEISMWFFWSTFQQWFFYNLVKSKRWCIYM